MGCLRQQQWWLWLLLLGCSAEKPLANVSPVAIDWNQTHQRISGFGASSAWTAPALDERLADAFFSLEEGIGLSLLRVRITPEGTTDERYTAHQAIARGAEVWASPWSPPGEWKTDGTAREGGRLRPQYYGAWAERLAALVRDLEDDGVPLLTVSAQNEPDYVATWETCEWTPEELSSFIGEHLAPALAEQGLTTPVLAPEPSGWTGLRRYTDAILAEPAARGAVRFVATHSYNGVAFPYAELAEHDKELWQTETSDEDREAGSIGMDSGLWVARTMHQDLTVANVNAWHYWWLLPRTDPEAGEDTNAALVYAGELTRRAYVMGQFSKFLRPGAVRIDAGATRPQTGVFVSAFRNEAADGIVIVAGNSNRDHVEQEFRVEGVLLEEVTPWVTSEDLALEEQASFASFGDGFSYQLEPRSVTTFLARVSTL